MLSPVALAAGDFLTWRIRLPDSGSSSPPCEKGEKRMEQYTTQMDAARRGIVTKELEIVAKKERMTVESISQLNDLSGDIVHKGEKLLLLKMVEGI